MPQGMHTANALHAGPEPVAAQAAAASQWPCCVDAQDPGNIADRGSVLFRQDAATVRSSKGLRHWADRSGRLEACELVGNIVF
mmetsp:Transcript_87874/g.246792  ORF Transcript_87874/g.246792 Transcript_87874/m.246792 type:complete len:83 (+) Transcript_87874:1181-1429(+)